MTARDEDIVWFCELLAPLGYVTARRMFGGAGLYVDGLIVGLEIEGTLYLKTDDLNRERFAAAGGSPFVYAGKGKAITTSYWTAPDEAMDSPEAMRPWARLAFEASLRRAAAKPLAKKTVSKKRSSKKKAASKQVMPKKVGSKQVGSKQAPTKRLDPEKSVSKKVASKRPV